MFTVMLAMALQAAPAAERWVELSRDDLLIESVDAGSMRIEGDRRIFRHRVAFTQPMPEDTVSMEFGTEVDCRRRTLALLSGTSRNSAGEIIQSYQVPEPIPRRRERSDREMIDFACRLNPG